MNPLFLNPWVLLGAGVLALSLLGGGYYKGHHDESLSSQVKIDKLESDAKEASQREQQARLIQASNASTGFENDNAKAKVVFREIQTMADALVKTNTIYLNTCFDDDGLRLANAALGGVSVKDISEIKQ